MSSGATTRVPRANGWRAPHWVVPGVLALLVIALLLGCIFLFPGYVVDRDLGTTAARLQAEARLKATNDVRTTLLQGLAGAFFLATAIFTWRQIRISQRQLELTQRQVQLSEQQQIAERFTRAVEQVGSEGLDVRVGGIFALEQIAQMSPIYRDAIIELLAAYVRTHAPWPAPDERDAGPPDSDLQTALTVLGRKAASRLPGSPPLNLCATDLRQADLRDADLPNVLLNRSTLAKARLERAKLGGARLVETDLQEARLDGADLRKARLIDANLVGTSLVGTNLREANLTGATVNVHSRLIRTRLEGAVLRGVALEDARYGGLIWDEKTEWPSGFVPRNESSDGPSLDTASRS